MINSYIPYEHAEKAFDEIINNCKTVQEANALFKAKEAVTSQVCNFIDLQPVKHGKWKHVAGMNSKCSVCSHYFPVTEFDSRPFDINYCPNCGARMDGDAE